MAELIDRSKLMFLLERELDMNGITDWGKGYMEAIHDAMEHVKFMTTTTEAEIRAKAIEEFAEKVKPIIDEKIKGWTNSDDLRRWCERAVDEIAEQLKEEYE